jgi:hypothetical protein
VVIKPGQQAAGKMNYDLIPYINVLLFSASGIDSADICSKTENRVIHSKAGVEDRLS